MTISLEIKQNCVEMWKSGKTARAVYDEYFHEVHPSMGYETFRTKLKRWKRQKMADPVSLAAGTYPGFTAHAATVQLDRNGELTQVWVKQTAEERNFDELLDVIRESTNPVLIPAPAAEAEPWMLEIPLFDLHFPLYDQSEALGRLLEIVRSRVWEEINIVIGQDMFHNDDFRGRTSSGREIEKVDMVKAWEMARNFWYTVITAAVEHSERVEIIYSKGNHDESMGWAFVQMLKAMFPQVDVNDAMLQRKVIEWRGCFIGLTHGHYKKSSKNDLRGQFTIQFPEAFARCKVREIHAGHLHNEDEKDIYGVMVRRLCRDGITDEWSDDEGLVGAHRRFMIFKWQPDRLAGIDYI